MNKKEKKESNFKKIKRLWKDPKGHALIVLGLYIIFFTSIFLFYLISNFISNNLNKIDEQFKEVNKSYSFKTSDNYEYKYTITYNIKEEKKINIEGIRYQTKDYFKVLETNGEFTIENNIIKSINNSTNPFIFDLVKIRPDNLVNYIYQANNSSEIKYNDGSIKTSYNINVSKFNILNDQTKVKTNNNQIKLITLEKDKRIISVEMDITNLVKLVNKNTIIYTIKIDYSNIGNISDFNIKTN